MSVDDVISKLDGFGLSLVEITGGEPLLQEATGELVDRLLDADREVLVETNGSLDVSVVDPRAMKIIDVKCPSSGMSDRIDFDNLSRLGPKDEVKFVVADREDYDFAVRVAAEYRLWGVHEVLLGPVYGELAPGELAEWMIRDHVRARLNLQLHKVIWGEERGR
jgi:7-carboxy-7-deazaguanine synthase